MKSSNSLFKHRFGGLFAALLGLCSISAAQAQIFVTNWGNGTVGEYNTDGSTVNASLVSGLYEPEGIAISGNDLYVVNGTGTINEYTLGATPGTVTGSTLSLVTGLNAPFGLAISRIDLFVASIGDGYADSGTVGEYSAVTGFEINATLISGLYQPDGLAISGNNLYVATGSDNTIGEYTLGTPPGTIASSTPSLVTTDAPIGLAISGNNLYVANYGNGMIAEYDATTGDAINAPLVSGLHNPEGLAISGNDLFVTNTFNRLGPSPSYIDTINAYDAATGAPINGGDGTLVSGLSDPAYLAVEFQDVPEPSTCAMLLGGLGLLAFWRHHTRRAQV